MAGYILDKRFESITAVISYISTRLVEVIRLMKSYPNAVFLVTQEKMRYLKSQAQNGLRLFQLGFRPIKIKCLIPDNPNLQKFNLLLKNGNDVSVLVVSDALHLPKDSFLYHQHLT